MVKWSDFCSPNVTLKSLETKSLCNGKTGTTPFSSRSSNTSYCCSGDNVVCPEFPQRMRHMNSMRCGNRCVAVGVMLGNESNSSHIPRTDKYSLTAWLVCPPRWPWFCNNTGWVGLWVSEPYCFWLFLTGSAGSVRFVYVSHQFHTGSLVLKESALDFLFCCNYFTCLYLLQKYTLHFKQSPQKSTNNKICSLILEWFQ